MMHSFNMVFVRIVSKQWFDIDSNKNEFSSFVFSFSIFIQIGQVLGWSWHPLSKHEIPIGVYEYTIPLELSFIEQIHRIFQSNNLIV